MGKRNGFFITLLSLVPFLFLLYESSFSELCLFLFSALLHEAGHVFAIRSLGYRAGGMHLFPAGAVLSVKADLIPYRRQLLLYLAGPFANFLCCGFALFLIRIHMTKDLLYFFFCNALLGLFNLLPVRGLDGERALSALFSQFASEEESVLRKSGAISAITLFLLFVSGAFLFWKSRNPSLLLLCFFLLLEQTDKKKTSRQKRKKATILS